MGCSGNQRASFLTCPKVEGAVDLYLYQAGGRDGDNDLLTWTKLDGPAGVTVDRPFSQVAEEREDGELVQRTEFGPLDLPVRMYRGDNSLMRRTTFDATGRPLALENGTGQTVTLAYNAAGFMSTVDLPPFNGQPDTLILEHDLRGQLVAVTKDYGLIAGTTRYTYDGNGNRTSIIDPRGQVMAFTYDTLGRMLSYTDKLGETATTTYDANGRELTRTNRNGEVLTKTYDSAGRLATMTGPGVDRSFAYDALGRRLEGRAGAHHDERVYDETGVRSVHVYGTDSAGHADATWSIANDAAGRLVDLVGPTVNGSTAMAANYGYDSRGRLSLVQEASLGTFAMTYDSVGRRSALERPSGANTTYAYDTADRPTAMTTNDAVGGLVHEILTSYDDRGIPDTQTDQEGRHDYEHDVRGRLVAVDHPDGAEFSDESYSYDTAERRTSSHRDAASEVVYDDGDRLQQDATYTYSYDLEGRRTARTHRVTGVVTTYTYDVLDHLVGLSEAGTNWVFTVDAQDLRVLVRASGATSFHESYVYDLNGTVRGTYAANEALTAGYLAGFGFGEVLARVDGAEALRDRLGTTVGWLEAGGLDLTVRDAYGVRAGAGGVVPFGYTGHAEDPTGLVWGRARYLETGRGLWTSDDVVYDEPRCSYVGGMSSFLVDLDGRSALSTILMSCAVAARSAAGATLVVGKWSGVVGRGLGGVHPNIGTALVPHSLLVLPAAAAALMGAEVISVPLAAGAMQLAAACETAAIAAGKP